MLPGEAPKSILAILIGERYKKPHVPAGSVACMEFPGIGEIQAHYLLYWKAALSLMKDGEAD